MLDKVKDYIPLNFSLLGNPVNWVIITLMVMLAGVALSFIMQSQNSPEEN